MHPRDCHACLLALATLKCRTTTLSFFHFTFVSFLRAMLAYYPPVVTQASPCAVPIHSFLLSDIDVWSRAMPRRGEVSTWQHAGNAKRCTFANSPFPCTILRIVAVEHTHYTLYEKCPSPPAPLSSTWRNAALQPRVLVYWACVRLQLACARQSARGNWQAAGRIHTEYINDKNCT